MYSAKSMLVVFLLLHVAFVAAAHAEPPDSSREEAVAALAKVKEKYKGLRDYQFERKTTILEARLGEKPSSIVEATFNTATNKAELPRAGGPILPLNPDCFRLEIVVNRNQFLMVGDGETSWWYSSRENIYQQGKGLMVIGSVPGSMLLALHLFPFTTMGAGALPDAKLVREESIEVNKQPRKCYVIQGHVPANDLATLMIKALAAAASGNPQDSTGIEPPFLGVDWLLTMLQAQGLIGDPEQRSLYTKVTPTKVTLWIDKAEHLLVRTEMSGTMQKVVINLKQKDKEPKREDVQLTLTDSFTLLKIDEALPKELFRFAPPKGAKELTPKRDRPREKN